LFHLVAPFKGSIQIDLNMLSAGSGSQTGTVLVLLEVVLSLLVLFPARMLERDLPPVAAADAGG
jgi:hypothetical protein